MRCFVAQLRPVRAGVLYRWLLMRLMSLVTRNGGAMARMVGILAADLHDRVESVFIQRLSQNRSQDAKRRVGVQ